MGEYARLNNMLRQKKRRTNRPERRTTKYRRYMF